MNDTVLNMRELFSSLWLNVTFYMALVFVCYLVGQRKAGDPNWYERRYNRAAIGLALYFGGLAITRLWGWLLIQTQADGVYSASLDAIYPVSVAGQAISMIGAVWLTAIFTPASWGNRGWVIASVCGALFILVTH
jgi:hypothetical protein